MLLYHEGSFLQILEGDQKTVEDLYEIISTDSRHTGLTEDDGEKMHDVVIGFRSG